jgi:hypothetical protein
MELRGNSKGARNARQFDRDLFLVVHLGRAEHGLHSAAALVDFDVVGAMFSANRTYSKNLSEGEGGWEGGGGVSQGRDQTGQPCVCAVGVRGLKRIIGLQ